MSPHRKIGPIGPHSDAEGRSAARRRSQDEATVDLASPVAISPANGRARQASAEGGVAVRRRRPQQRQAEILEAALDLFSECGFAGTRLEDVAVRAGLSKAAIYLYFDDKTALLKAILQQTAGASVDTVAAVIASHDGPVAPLLRQLIGTLAGRLDGTRLPDVIKLVISESRAHPEIGRLYLENVIGRALPLMQQLIERGIASGEFRAVDAALAVKCLMGPMVLAAVWRSVLEPIGAAPLAIPDLASLHVDLLLAGLLSPDHDTGQRP